MTYAETPVWRSTCVACGMIPPGVEYTGIIDTGFTGFLQLPLGVAFELALPLEGTTSVTLADARRRPSS